MTLEGTLQKTGILFGLATVSAVGSIALGFIMPALLYPMMLLGMFGTAGMVFSFGSLDPQNLLRLSSFMQRLRGFSSDLLRSSLKLCTLALLFKQDLLHSE